MQWLYPTDGWFIGWAWSALTGGVFGVILYLFKRQFRDFYVVEMRYVERNAAGHYVPQKLEASHLISFDDYAAARAYFDRQEESIDRTYESTEQINFLSVGSAISRRGAERRYKKHGERMLVRTPYSVISQIRKEWREELQERAELREELAVMAKATAERVERGG